MRRRGTRERAYNDIGVQLAVLQTYEYETEKEGTGRIRKLKFLLGRKGRDRVKLVGCIL